MFYWELSEASEKESLLRKAIELVTTAVTIGGFQEDQDEMSRKQVRNIPSTPHFDFLTGSYSNPNWTVPYFVTSMTFSDAAQSLHLTSQRIPGSEEITWSIDELYQRDIDWRRVRDQDLPLPEPWETSVLPCANDCFAAVQRCRGLSGTTSPVTNGRPLLSCPNVSKKPCLLGRFNSDTGTTGRNCMIQESLLARWWNTHQLFESRSAVNTGCSVQGTR